ILAGGVVVQVGEVEHPRRVAEVGLRHELPDEEDRVDDAQRVGAPGDRADLGAEVRVVPVDLGLGAEAVVRDLLEVDVERQLPGRSTRLNSSHVKISYAVFCLKKKK